MSEKEFVKVLEFENVFAKFVIDDGGEKGFVVRIVDKMQDNVLGFWINKKRMVEVFRWLRKKFAIEGFALPDGLHQLLTKMQGCKDEYKFEYGDKSVIRDSVSAILKIEELNENQDEIEVKEKPEKR